MFCRERGRMKNMGVIASPCHAVLTVASIDGILPKPLRTFPNGEQAQGAYTVSTTDWIWFDAGCQLLAEVPEAFRADVQILHFFDHGKKVGQ
jgi:hypothetical protein